jgi:hypothetical protein
LAVCSEPFSPSEALGVDPLGVVVFRVLLRLEDELAGLTLVALTAVLGFVVVIGLVVVLVATDETVDVVVALLTVVITEVVVALVAVEAAVLAAVAFWVLVLVDVITAAVVDVGVVAKIEGLATIKLDESRARTHFL